MERTPPIPAKPLRVLHAIDAHSVGGVEVLLSGYLRHPLAAEMEHHALLTGTRCHADMLGAFRQHARGMHWPRYAGGVKLPVWPHALRRWRSLSAIRRAGPDVIVLWNLMGDWRLLEACLASGAAVMHYEHGAAWQAAHLDEMRRLAPGVNGFLCCAHAARRVLELRLGLPAGVAKALRNPLRYGMQAGPARRLRPGERVRLGAGGRLVPLKGIALAVHALRRALDRGVPCDLTIVGDGPEAPALRALAERLGVAGAVRFLGYVGDIRSFYAGIDIFLCPSLREPFAGTCVEAAAMACPVLCPAVDGFPENVLDGETGYCLPPTLPVERYEELGGRLDGLPMQVYDPARDALVPVRMVNPDHLAERVCRLWEQPDLYARMSRAARDRIAASFGFDDYARGVNDHIRAAVDGRRPSA